VRSVTWERVPSNGVNRSTSPSVPQTRWNFVLRHSPISTHVNVHGVDTCRRSVSVSYRKFFLWLILHVIEAPLDINSYF
jgi:hypothetical protein